MCMDPTGQSGKSSQITLPVFTIRGSTGSVCPLILHIGCHPVFHKHPQLLLADFSLDLAIPYLQNRIEMGRKQSYCLPSALLSPRISQGSC